MSARSRPRDVLVGALAGFLALTVLAVTAGSLVAHYVPPWALRLAGGLLFLAFAVHAALAKERAEEPSARTGMAGAFLAVAVGEMGDKTQLATATLAGQGSPIGVGLGAFAALAASSVLAVLLGARLARWVPARTLRWVSVALFALGGLLLLASIWISV